MNELSYKFKKDVYIGSQKGLGFEIIIDGNAINYFFPIEQLKKSAEKEGFYWILEGVCGQPECCGAYVKVVHENNKIIWSKFFIESYQEKSEFKETMPNNKLAYRVSKFSIAENEFLKLPLEFEKKKYQELAQTLVDEAIKNS